MDYIKEIDNLYKQQREYLNELFVTYGSKGKKGIKYEINVQSDMGARYSTLPYFKFSISPISSAKYIARIPILPDKNGNYFYQIHHGGVGLHFVLNSQELKILDKMLKSSCMNTNFTNNWSYLIYQANQIIMTEPDVETSEKRIIPSDTPIPDYKNLLKEK